MQVGVVQISSFLDIHVYKRPCFKQKILDIHIAEAIVIVRLQFWQTNVPARCSL